MSGDNTPNFPFIAAKSGSETPVLQAHCPDDCAGQRLDVVASLLFKDYSRAILQRWIKSGLLSVDGESKSPKSKLLGGECLSLSPEPSVELEAQPEALEMEVVYEDAQLIVINKAANVVVHPAAGHRSGTLLNGLLYRYPELQNLARAGIVHRLDKDTTGLMVVARTQTAHFSLVQQLQARTVSRQYQAIACGRLAQSRGCVDANIGRHPQQRQKMAVLEHGGKEARTHFLVLKRYREYSHLQLKLETGRTHQIRVHMAHIGHPLLGDPVYGVRKPSELGRQLARQALHAEALSLQHPQTGESMHWQAPLPEDFQTCLEALRQENVGGGE